MTTQPSQLNADASETLELAKSTLGGGRAAPSSFQALIQKLLTLTILKEGSAVTLHHSVAGNPKRFIISGPSRSFAPLPLTNGAFIYLFYDLQLDEKEPHYLLVQSSKIAYQLDEAGERMVFRFEYNRRAPDQYPSAHLHVHGNWNCEVLDKEMYKIHWPVVRTTLEAVIRLLVYDFELITNRDSDTWRPCLDVSEREFLKVATTLRTEDSAPH